MGGRRGDSKRRACLGSLAGAESMGEAAEITGELQLPIHNSKCNGRLLTLPECLVCRSSVTHYERVDGTLRRMGWHCAGCHSTMHNSCTVCTVGLPDRSRSD